MYWGTSEAFHPNAFCIFHSTSSCRAVTWTQTFFVYFSRWQRGGMLEVALGTATTLNLCSLTLLLTGFDADPFPFALITAD